MVNTSNSKDSGRHRTADPRQPPPTRVNEKERQNNLEKGKENVDKKESSRSSGGNRNHYSDKRGSDGRHDNRHEKSFDSAGGGRGRKDDSPGRNRRERDRDSYRDRRDDG